MTIGTMKNMNNARSVESISAEKLAESFKSANINLGDKTPKSLPELDALIATMEAEKQKRDVERRQKIAELEAELQVVKKNIAEIKGIDFEEEEPVPETPAEIVESVVQQDADTVLNNEKVLTGIFSDLTPEETTELNSMGAGPAVAKDQDNNWLKKALDAISFNPNLARLTKKIRLLVLSGALFVGSTGFMGTNSDGGFELEKFNINNLVDRTTSILPEVQQEWAKRWLEKKGVYETEDVQLISTETADAAMPKVHMQTAAELAAQKASQDSTLAAAAAEKYAAEMKAYKESLTSFKILGTVPDCVNKNDSIFSYRSQWLNDEGFTYVAGPNVGQQNKTNIKFKDVIGVGHFLLDASLFGGKAYSHRYNSGFLEKAKEKNDYIPCFSFIDKTHVKVQYKKANDVAKDDIVISPLRQFKFSQINFNKKIHMPNKFASTIFTNPTSDGNASLLLFKSRDGYNRFSGGSVVFIFEDQYGNQIVRDFAGTNRQIENEGKAIMKQFGIDASQLTIGYHDVGSFSAKPKAKQGVLNTRQWAGFNNNTYTGGALLIPASVL